MSNKVELIYENNEFKIILNGSVLYSDKKIDNAVNKFKQVVRDNTSKTVKKSWEEVYESVKNVKVDGVISDKEFKTIEFQNMKYFYVTDKLFYILNNNMVLLNGGYELIIFIMNLIKSEKIKDCDKLLKFLNKMSENNILYRTADETLCVSSPGFNYGFVEYNFGTGKINKGTAILSGTFEEYVAFVLENI